MNLKTFIIQLVIGLFCVPISAQEVLKVTAIPHYAVDYREPEDIRVMDGKFVVPIFGAGNTIFEFLAELEVDSFDTPYNVFRDEDAPATLYGIYKPYVGFTDKVVLNIMAYSKKVNFEGDYVLYTERTPVFGLNDNMPFDFPTTNEEYSNSRGRIAVYNIPKDTFDFLYSFGDYVDYDLTSDIQGDYIYVNVPLTWDEDDDLIFMGDTLTYEHTSYYGGSNYLSKINFKTGEKIWTRHIGYGDVKQIVVDNKNRINIDFHSPQPAMYNFEWTDPDYNGGNGWYDRLIYRMSPDGELTDHTYIHTYNDPSIYKVEFNDNGSFQAFGMVSSPMFINVEGDSLDFQDAYSADEGKGLVLVYNEDLEFVWGEKIVAEGRAIVNAVNKSPEGNYVISSSCKTESISVDGVLFDGPPPPLDLDDPLSQSILIKFNPEGVLLGSPVFGAHRAVIEDLQALGEEHYLINYRRHGNYTLDFVGEVFWSLIDFTYLIEYKGDIFDVMTNVEGHFTQNEIKISPNPVARGENVRINLPDHFDKDSEVKLYNTNGRFVNTKYMNNRTYKVPENLESGLYYFCVRGSKIYNSIPLFIQ